MIVDVVIPALNEERAVGLVVGAIPRHLVRHIVVCNNGSTDNTAEVARHAGAQVVDAPQRGYGSACLAGLDWCKSQLPRADVIAFLDADYSDDPRELPLLLEPIAALRADLVIGSRALGHADRGALLPQQRFGNWLATRLMRLIWGARFTDLGPFRAITFAALDKLKMSDPNYGWTVEMQIKALLHHLRYEEVPVSYKKRIGYSKVAGTLKGSFLAGYKILFTIAKYGFSR